ncbi:GyrI-like domain-containing protein [Actinoallomurus acanthiterrae]
MNRYKAAEEPELVEFGPVRGLSVSGVGEPGGPEHLTSIGALYAVAGSLAARNDRGFDLPPLEGRWWVEDERPPLEVPREEWRWHLFLPLPETVEDAWYDEARQAAPHPAAARVQLVTYTEGRCVQILHRGPYADEPRSLAKMDALTKEAGLVPNGLHHEIYLSDFRETDPEKIRTILRHPVRAA